MKPSALVYDFLSLGLTLLFISLVNADLQQIKDQSALDDVKKSPSGSIVFFNHSSEKPGLYSFKLALGPPSFLNSKMLARICHFPLVLSLLASSLVSMYPK